VTRLVLLPSPLLGAAVWGPVAEELRVRGWPVTTAAAGPGVRTPADVLDGLLRDVPDEPGIVLVPHSNAGLYVAALAAARDVAGIVFVDAGLPSRAWETPTAPAELRAMLAGLADGAGLLPPWTSWWPTEDVSGLFPDAETRRRVEDEQARLPLSYFDGRVPSPPGWESLPAAYLAFGETYRDEHAEAVRRGWAVRSLPGEHLHMLVDPRAVVEALVEVVGPWGARPGPPTEN